jgi:hypothetical protein
MEDIFNNIEKAIDAKYSEQSEAAPDTGHAKSELAPSADQAVDVKESQGAKSAEAQAIFDLSQAKEFMFKGQKMTLKDLESRMMMQSDYTKKMQEFSQDRKYRDNLETDIEALRQNPNLLSKFKEVYPKHYHKAAEYAVSNAGQSQQQTQGTPTQDHLVKQLVNEAIGPIRSELDQYKTDAAVKQIEAVFETMKTKFPQAEEEFVLARLQMLKDQDVPINQAKIQEVFKHFHDRDQQAKEAYHMDKLNKQKQANQKAKDVPSGGGTPGQAPKKYKSLSDLDSVQKDLYNHLTRTP